MKRVTGLALVGALSLVLAAPAHAGGAPGGGFHGGQGSMHAMGSQHRNGFQHRSGFQHRGHVHRGCCWGGGFIGWPLGASLLAAPYYADPYYAYPSSYPVYSDPGYAPAYSYQPQQQVYVAPPAQSELCYIGGCYRLQGDGVSVPFRWVWIPSAPAPPPPPPTGPPAGAPMPGAPMPADPSSSRPTQKLYRWVDDQGITNWTNNREAVPEQYRAKLKQTM